MIYIFIFLILLGIYKFLDLIGKYFSGNFLINDNFLLFNMIWQFFIFDESYVNFYSQLNNNNKYLMHKYYRKGYEKIISLLSLKDLFIIHKPMYMYYDNSTHWNMNISDCMDGEIYRLIYSDEYNNKQLEHLWISGKVIKFDKLF